MASLPPDPWKALGVDKNADKSEIRTAYKKLVLKCHPDKVQDPALKAQKQDEFQKVQQAYELLNDDAERTKYEDQLKLHELRKQAAMMAKSMPNTSASRSTPPRQYEIRTAYKPSSSSSPKVYSYQTSSRSHEDVPLRYDAPDKTARRPSSFEKASYREEDRRDRDRDRERRSRRDPEDDYRIKEIKEKERAIREKEKELKERERDLRKKSGRDRDIDRKRGQEEKRRNFSPYIEEPIESAEDQPAYSSSKPEKKRSSSKKPYETRDKSTASRRAPSPHIEPATPTAPMPPAVQEEKYTDDLDKAATYIERSRRQSNRAVQEPPVFSNFPPVVPTPPPAEPHEDDVAHRSRARRASHDASRSREKLMAAPSSSSRDPYINIVSASPKSGRAPPPLHKSYTSPLVAEASSPPRSGINRSDTTPMGYANSAPHVAPSFSRAQTWGGAGQEYPHDYSRDNDSDDDHRHRHRHRRSDRRRSPEAPRSATYKVGADHKTTKVDSHYPYGVSPNSARYMPPEAYDHHTSSSYPTHFKVKESRAYGPADVKYADARYNVAYAQDQYYHSVGAA
ncbi:hypothetical protein B0T16DRAFT_387352 [Cercophora newfieldiana]|uniref:J domain-containing protein n=1 Tax=Cercophora newfieldiana TaxID=92897 RepID=A0AA39YI73_9PEZI|nr:hypothetical protein B0T16DRAFT_387352 [Cercophora newfieldiana]